MNKNFIFKELDISVLKEILTEIANLQSKMKPEPGRFRIIDTQSTLNELPTLVNWFKENEIDVRQTAYISIEGKSKQEVHLDSGVNELALNFPVLNCENVTTEFFEYKEQNLILKYTVGTNLPYYAYDTTDVGIIASFNLTKPTLLNIKMPHRVVNNTDLERISLSFRFKEDPWKLV